MQLKKKTNFTTAFYAATLICWIKEAKRPVKYTAQDD
jgi:hypothetical protein